MAAPFPPEPSSSTSSGWFYQGASDEARLERVHRMVDEEKVDAPRRWYLAEPDLPAKRQRRPSNPTFPEGFDDFLDEVRRRSRQ